MVTKITNTFDEEEISKLSVGEKIQKGYYEVIDEEEWQKDMQAKYGNMSEKCERLQKQLDIAVEGLKKYESGEYIFSNNDGISTGSMKLAADNGRTARKYLKQIEELNK